MAVDAASQMQARRPSRASLSQTGINMRPSKLTKPQPVPITSKAPWNKSIVPPWAEERAELREALDAACLRQAAFVFVFGNRGGHMRYRPGAKSFEN